ncbi:MaoC family dehydratase [Alcanivorax sp. JB21]|uniref:MaoC family dehydratase n=1 Tax=Alcanivorax limicola TaxID=2874102 RepID=UPI001CBBCAE7|nr:MaoC family dehydratase [Alcanivorax limicola]MBZ2187543.1 MaoC family dehydratase [Alcanivorax limicola]
MTAIDYDLLHVGDTLPVLVTAPVSRLDLALYCGASGDHNPIHVDIDFARQAGMDDVFAHGMLSMAFLGRLLTDWVPQHQLRTWSVRFVAITHVGDAITCQGEVAEKFEQDGERRVRLALTTRNQHDDIKLKGEAVIGFPV